MLHSPCMLRPFQVIPWSPEQKKKKDLLSLIPPSKQPDTAAEAMLSLPCALSRGLKHLFQWWRMSPSDFINLRTIHKDSESWHCSYANLLGNLLLRISINFIETDMSEALVVWQRLKNRRNHPARSTPWCPEVDHNRLITRDDFLKLREPTIPSSSLTLANILWGEESSFDNTHDSIAVTGILGKRFCLRIHNRWWDRNGPKR